MSTEDWFTYEVDEKVGMTHAHMFEDGVALQADVDGA